MLQKKPRESWTKKDINVEDRTYTFTNKGNMYVDMSVKGKTLLTFQLPVANMHNETFFRLFVKVYETGLATGIEAGRIEFSKQLHYLTEYHKQ